MIEDYKILVKKYRYNSGIDPDKVNYFSDEIKTLESVFDLTKYIIQEESFVIESNRVRVEEKLNTKSLRRRSSNIEFSISDIDLDMREFFEVFNNSTYVIFKVELMNSDNEVEWVGLLRQSSIEELIEDAEENEDLEAIKVNVASFDVEFKEYFSNKKLSEVTIQWNTHTLGLNPMVVYKYFMGGSNYQYFNFESQQLFRVLEQIFGIGIEVESSFYNYNVSRRSFLVRRDAQGVSNFVYIKTGFERIQDTEETCWGFLEKLCNSRGWDFYFMNENLRVENRYKQNTARQTLSINDFKDVTIKKDKAERTFKNIFIYDGEIVITGTGGSDRKKYEGQRLRYLGGNYRYGESNHFSVLRSNFKPALLPGHLYTRFYNNENDNIRLVTYLYETLVSEYAYTTLSDYLSINAGSTGNYMTAYNEEGGYNYLYEKGSDVLGGGGDEFAYSGNYGNCVFRIENNKVITYQDDSKSNLFLQNFFPLLSSKVITNRLVGEVTCDIKDYQEIDIVDGGAANGLYMIDSFDRDLEKETTELELIKLLEDA